MKKIIYLLSLTLGFLIFDSCKKSDPRPVPTAAFTWANAGEGIVQFTDISKEADTYSWDFGDATTISTEKSPKHDYGKNGKFTVSLTVKNESGENKSSQTIDVSNIPAPKNDFTFAPGTDGIVTFTNATTGATTYSWDFGDGTNSTETNPKKTYTENKKYTVTLTATGKGGTSKSSKDVEVVSLKPSADFNWTETTGTIIFTNISKNADSYAWDFGDGTNSIEVTPKKTYSKNGNYTVKLTATGKGGVVSVSKVVNVANIVANASIPTLYIATSTQLLAVDTDKGTERWAFEMENYTNTEPTSSPTFANGIVYVGCADGNLFAVDAKAGTKKWSYKTGAGIISTPTVVNGIVYFGSKDKNIYALDAQTGSLKWKYVSYDVRASPTVVDGIVYIPGYDGNINAINAITGIKKWSFQPTGIGIFSSPAVVGGIVYAASYSKFYALNASTGAVKWTLSTNRDFKSSPTVFNNAVYVGNEDGKVYSYDANTGSVKWSFNLVEIGITSPVISNSILYIGNYKQDFYALDANTGSVKWKYTMNSGLYDNGPVVANGVVYIANEKDKLLAIDAATGKLKWKYGSTSSYNFSSACVVDAQGNIYYSGISGDEQ